MTSRHVVADWAKRQLRGVGSLASASFIVVAVMVFALHSLGAPSDQEQVGAARANVVPQRIVAADQPAPQNAPTLYIKSLADRPIVLTAEIKTHGWKNRGQKSSSTPISETSSQSIPKPGFAAGRWHIPRAR